MRRVNWIVRAYLTMLSAAIAVGFLWYVWQRFLVTG